MTHRADMIEGAAKAAYEAMMARISTQLGAPVELTWETEPEELREDWRMAICAVLKAIREPTPAMLLANISLAFPWDDGNPEAALTDVYQGMIDAILVGKP